MSIDTIILRPDYNHPNASYYGMYIAGRNLADLVKHFPLEITMPCGETREITNVEDVPKEDVPCPCGNPKHFFVKWEDLDG